VLNNKTNNLISLLLLFFTGQASVFLSHQAVAAEDRVEASKAAAPVNVWPITPAKANKKFAELEAEKSEEKPMAPILQNHGDKKVEGILVRTRPDEAKSPISQPQSEWEVQAHEPAPFHADDAVVTEDQVLRFEIQAYHLDGATLLSKEETDKVLSHYIGKSKDFSDVQRALEGIEALYAQKGFSAVHVLLPEQELEQGNIHFEIIESRFSKVTIKNDSPVKYVSEANVLNAIPSVRVGGIPRSKQIARELKLANENPARQLNVVLKAGERDEDVEAGVIVTETKPGAWGVTVDNTGSPETGRSRLGLSYRHANVFDKDHVANMQVQVSPQFLDRVKVLGLGYKIPLYQLGDSVDFSGGYSNVNSLVGGLSNFQGGGITLGARYNQTLEKRGSFEPHLAYGLDYRDFKAVKQTTPPVTVLFNEIMVLPVSLAYTTQGKLGDADLGLNAAFALNLPALSKGHMVNFKEYDLVDPTKSYTARYKVLRFGGNYMRAIARDWQLRVASNGQYSGDVLIQGEQLRLGGSDGVRGYSEGSEGGESGVRGNLELYSPAFNRWSINTRGVFFFDAGAATASNGMKSSISGYGVGMRTGFGEQINLRMDAGRILKAGSDPQQPAGTWRIHAALTASF